jgi:hypothetical protein
MILTPEQITDIVLHNPNKDMITKGRKYHKTMCLHIYGQGMESHVSTIQGFETPALKELRAKYSKNNKDLFARLIRPIDKIFTARGGSIYYNLSESGDKQAMALTSSKVLKGGKNLKEWIKDNWKPHFLDDPFGVCLVELDKDGQAYPTYKAITSIYDYATDGVKVEYIVFEVTKPEKKMLGLKESDVVYRVYDDAFDYMVKVESETVTPIKELTFKNFFGYVPGMINSDITDPCGCGWLSLFDDIISLADDFLLTGSIKTTHKFLHGFPKYWEYADDCPKCGGNKTFGGDPCPDCKGTGKNIMSRVSDAKLLTYPQSKDDPTVTPNVAGYVEPSEIYHNISTSELSALEDAMNFTIWGKSNDKKPPQVNVSGQQDSKTATQVLDEVKPEESRLIPISESAEKRHKFILDAIVDVKIKIGYSQGGGSSVNYGRRYMLESGDVILSKYTSSKTAGANVGVLDDLLIDYLETEYSGDPVKMAIKIKETQIEPFIHMKVAEVDLSASITAEDKAAKVYYTEWRRTINDGMILVFTTEMLKEQLYKYAAEKAKTVLEAKTAEVKLNNSFKQPFAA